MMVLRSVLTLISLCICAISIVDAQTKVNDFKITCKDESGNNVDWYYLYKLPRLSEAKGHMYAYITANAATEFWTVSELTVDDLNSIPGRTVSQAYFDPSETPDRLLVAYNDEPPNKKQSSNKGHLKGVLVADQRSGFWLVHSVPHYPNISVSTNDYYYPATGYHYGQSFLCLSLSAEQINAAAGQLVYNEPQIYEAILPPGLKTQYPNVERLIQSKSIKDGPFYKQIDLQTLDSVVFKSFAKSSKFDHELYEDWVAPTLNSNLYVETWRNGPGNFASNCSRTTRVWNVSKIKLNKDFTFPTTHDHSKWGVGDENSDWICVGDINRAMKQTRRGGGTVCHRSKSISDSYRSMIVDFEPCKQSKFKSKFYYKYKKWSTNDMVYEKDKDIDFVPL